MIIVEGFPKHFSQNLFHSFLVRHETNGLDLRGSFDTDFTVEMRLLAI